MSCYHGVSRPVLSSRWLYWLYCAPYGSPDTIPEECHLHLGLVANRDGDVFLCLGIQRGAKTTLFPLGFSCCSEFWCCLSSHRVPWIFPWNLLPPVLFLSLLASLPSSLHFFLSFLICASSWSWHLLYFLFEFSTLAMSYHIILISKGVRLPWHFSLFPKGCMYF